jgi:hypothetical protein
MKFWTAHLRRDTAPVLIPEAFSIGALVFGPLWLALHQAWIPAALSLTAAILIAALAPEPIDLVLSAALALLLGLSGHDLRRWSMERRGYLLGHVLAAPSEPEALARLFTYRPDLTGHFLPAREAR